MIDTFFVVGLVLALIFSIFHLAKVFKKRKYGERAILSTQQNMEKEVPVIMTATVVAQAIADGKLSSEKINTLLTQIAPEEQPLITAMAGLVEATLRSRTAAEEAMAEPTSKIKTVLAEQRQASLISKIRKALKLAENAPSLADQPHMVILTWLEIIAHADTANPISYEKAQEQAQILAQYILGIMYQTGQGVNRDYDKAFACYEEAAKQGNTQAQSNLGAMYQAGLGVTQDDAKAFQCYEEAAAHGNAIAQYNLGVMYQSGQGVNIDYSKAFAYYEKAAQQGNAQAQTNLGVMYQTGLGTPQDYAKAAQWSRKAALQGNAQAQTNLGVMYQTGLGVKQNFTKAAQWYQKALAQGHKVAQRKLQELAAANKLPPPK